MAGVRPLDLRQRLSLDRASGFRARHHAQGVRTPWNRRQVLRPVDPTSPFRLDTASGGFTPTP
jgi:hypothetical protein